jgi:hypothetical protein
VIRSFKVLFCDNEHGTGDVMFPEDLVEDIRNFVEARTATQLRRDAKKAGWSKVGRADYCPGCTEINNDKETA